MTTSISMVNFCGNTFLSTTTATSSSSSNTTSTTSNNSTSSRSHVSSLAFRRRRRRTTRRNRHIFRLLSPNAKKKTRPWWHTFFSDTDDAIWSDWSADDVLGYDADEPQQQLSDDTDKFESWKRKVEAITELREAQESATSAQDREWEDWLGDNLSSSNITTSSWDQDDAQPVEPLTDISNDAFKKGFVQSVTNLFLRLNDDNDDNDDVDELLFEDRVFRYASTNSAKFIALLILIPWALDFLFHDFIFMPFLDRYVKTVPLAAELLDVRRHQKLEMVKALKVERARFQFEVEIGKSPPLSDDEVWLELQHKAIELRDEWRLENRRAFANIWSDMVYGISLFILIYSNKGKVALLKFTGYKLINNISDTGKAFMIILITDIFLGYHSESGWQALVEIMLEHYGLQVDPAAITIFICFVPVVIDACVKLWLFKFLPRLSPNVANIFREMKRH